jgi:U3 small nucleolar RNA-associated protein 7
MQVVDRGAAHKAFDISLPALGPYCLSFTRSGRYVAIAGAKGHLALMDWSRMYTACEVQVRETTRDVCVLHNEQFFAAAQKKYVYIYDRRGFEVHCCKEHGEPAALDFLPHHFLLVSAGLNGVPRRADANITCGHTRCSASSSCQRPSALRLACGLGARGCRGT